MTARKPADEPKVEAKATDSKPAALRVAGHAPLVQITTEDTKVLHLRSGDIVPSSASKASVEHLKSLGFVE